jgi:ferrochelatase
MNKQGILLINLGTPKGYGLKSIRRYLKQFLYDPRVIDLTFWVRFFLVNFIVLPRRAHKVSLAYQKIWLKEGSPLLVYSTRMQNALAAELGKNYQVALGMRYGIPSIETALSQLKDCEVISVLPLFPQYSSAATGSAIAEFFHIFSKKWNIPHIQIKKDFYNDPAFIAAYASIILKHIEEKNPDILLFSYHSLPKRHLSRSHCHFKCEDHQVCCAIDQKNLCCYRAQCYATSALLAEHLNLNASQYSVSFQSRLGTTPWIGPYTDEILPKLRAEGVENIAVACPSFVVDCLETLEEIDLRAREQWRILGGGEFTFIPCLNDEPLWIKGLASMLK